MALSSAKTAQNTFESQQEEIAHLKDDYKQAVDNLQTQLTQVTKEAQDYKEKSSKALQNWIMKYAFSVSSEKRQIAAECDVRVGSVVLQQMGHRVIETWREGDVGHRCRNLT